MVVLYYFWTIFPHWAFKLSNIFDFQDAAAERASKIFRELDINGDGELDEDEFVKGCMDDSDLMSMLNSGGLADEEMK